MRRLVTRAGLLLAGMLAVGALLAPAASAHAVRLFTDPADNAVLTTGPARVSATFNEQLETTFAAMTVVGPDGNIWSRGDTTVQGAVAQVELRPLGPVGTYTVNYRVTSADGHVVSGSWSFRLSVAGTGTPGPRAAGGEPTDSGPVWPAVGVVVLVVAIGLWWFRRRKL
ncbi:copper resistance CopC family protein [Mycobacterium sherrisii]|uniref:Copper resistance protein CopC n=1 Tax=Mycobacterium sherrisii TaxID=243061 RepID=A0A1E3SQY7_9MYCO|nr:copper resistance CopC family protein [Mycobacterium sherrisii]MCV7029413.1 copper resistance protein CopC [Mycobacterium sherrisii]MEC4761553.1 copper resistance CopC family protein [Mycobacterium sherrisii]ODR04587.1 copper resistance protein CopC [Mycobacterium sherrisii]ORW73237.1 copper resistance protein CopC [Mycobacterium sherrisii]